MTIEEVKRWLNRAYKLDELIQLDKKKIEELEELSTTISGFCSGEKVQNSINNDAKFINVLLKKDEALKKYNHRVIERINLKVEIDEAINKIDDNQIIQILTFRYLQFLKFREISSVTYMSIGNVQRLHDKGLKILAGIIK